MQYSKHRRDIERLYVDRATISRLQDMDAPNGATRESMVTIYTDVPCRLSQRTLAANSQTEAQNDIRYELKLFISPDLRILQGDEITVMRSEIVFHLMAGEPFPYSTHQEISLQRRGYA